MRGRLGELLQTVVHRVVPPDPPTPSEPAVDDLAEIREAHRQWLAAKAYFESVSEPELVDHAIAVLTAAERRFNYLMARARRLGLNDAEVGRVLMVPLSGPAPVQSLPNGHCGDHSEPSQDWHGGLSA